MNVGCYSVIAAVESEAVTLPTMIKKMLLTTTSDWQDSVIDLESEGSMEKKMQEGDL